MCKRHSVGPQRTEPSAYEGKTIRFGEERITSERTRSCGGWNGFPWWSLWLLWPLFGLIKTIVPLVPTMVASSGHVLVPIVPLLLIGLGIWLLQRR